MYSAPDSAQALAEARAWADRGQRLLPELGRALAAQGRKDAVPEVVALAAKVAELHARLQRAPPLDAF